jgi:hypothetical protein
MRVKKYANCASGQWIRMFGDSEWTKSISAKLNLMHHMCKMSKHGYELKLSIAKEFIKNMAVPLVSLCSTCQREKV